MTIEASGAKELINAIANIATGIQTSKPWMGRSVSSGPVSKDVSDPSVTVAFARIKAQVLEVLGSLGDRKGLKLLDPNATSTAMATFIVKQLGSGHEPKDLGGAVTLRMNKLIEADELIKKMESHLGVSFGLLADMTPDGGPLPVEVSKFANSIIEDMKKADPQFSGEQVEMVEAIVTSVVNGINRTLADMPDDNLSQLTEGDRKEVIREILTGEVHTKMKLIEKK